MAEEKQFNRFIVAHYCCGQRIINQFQTLAEAESWWRFLQNFGNIEATEIIGVTEERHLLKGWKNERKAD